MMDNPESWPHFNFVSDPAMFILSLDSYPLIDIKDSISFGVHICSLQQAIFPLLSRPDMGQPLPPLRLPSDP